MKDINEIKKFPADKVAFLALLVIALLVAQLVSYSKSVIKLTSPVILDRLGLSVKMPQGNGWQCSKKWNFIENQYILASVFFNPVNRQMTASVKCQYLLAAQKTPLEALFQKKASQFNAKIINVSQTQMDSLTVDWAQIKDPSGQNLFAAIAKLPDKRQLNIELIELTGDTVLAERVFQAIIKNITFNDNQRLRAGAEIVSQIKDIGIIGFLFQPQNDFFLIKNSENRNIGFSMDFLADSGQFDQMNIRAQSFIYIKDTTVPFETSVAFQSNNSFDQFSWTKETSTGQGNTQMTLDKAGRLNIKKFLPRDEQFSINLNPAAIPDIFLKQLFEQMLNSDYDNILVDVIEAGGSVTPMLVTKITKPENYALAIKIQLLNDQQLYQNIYFNSQMTIAKIVQSTNIILEKTTMENIIKTFPEKAAHVLEINRAFEQKISGYNKLLKEGNL